jgi:hypothetical protein
MKPLAMKLVPAVAALALMGAAGSAQADAYAYSYDNIFGLTVSNTGTVTVAGTTDVSRATATLNGTNVITGGVNFLDAPQAAVGAVTTGENTFSQQGMGPASYSRGDAQIVSTQFPPFPVGATSTQAVNAAESFVTPTGSADASGRNGSTTGFSVLFGVTSPTATLSFDFNADPYMQVFLSTLAGPGSSSTANLVVTFSITNAAGATVFNWSPDGLLGSGIVGGTEAADAANLNINLSTNTLTAGSVFTYDPTGCGAPVGSATGTGCGGLFSATTADLVAGNYTLTLNAVESTDLTVTPTAVPEPGTLALLGIGLAGLCLTSRRKQPAA